MAECRYKDWILDSIDSLRSRKARPDRERICRMVERRHGVAAGLTQAALEHLVASSLVVKVSYKGSHSYRNAAKCRRGRTHGMVLPPSASSMSHGKENDDSGGDDGGDVHGGGGDDDEEMDGGGGGGCDGGGGCQAAAAAVDGGDDAGGVSGDGEREGVKVRPAVGDDGGGGAGDDSAAVKADDVHNHHDNDGDGGDDTLGGGDGEGTAGCRRGRSKPVRNFAPTSPPPSTPSTPSTPPSTTPSTSTPSATSATSTQSQGKAEASQRLASARIARIPVGKVAAPTPRERAGTLYGGAEESGIASGRAAARRSLKKKLLDDGFVDPSVLVKRRRDGETAVPTTTTTTTTTSNNNNNSHPTTTTSAASAATTAVTTTATITVPIGVRGTRRATSARPPAPTPSPTPTATSAPTLPPEPTTRASRHAAHPAGGPALAAGDDKSDRPGSAARARAAGDPRAARPPPCSSSSSASSSSASAASAGGGAVDSSDSDCEPGGRGKGSAGAPRQGPGGAENGGVGGGVGGAVGRAGEEREAGRAGAEAGGVRRQPSELPAAAPALPAQSTSAMLLMNPDPTGSHASLVCTNEAPGQSSGAPSEWMSSGRRRASCFVCAEDSNAPLCCRTCGSCYHPRCHEGLASRRHHTHANHVASNTTATTTTAAAATTTTQGDWVCTRCDESMLSGKPSPPAPATPREDAEHTAEVPEVRGASCLPTPSASPSPASQGDPERSPPHHNGAEGLKLLEPADWSIADVASYFRTAGFDEEARAFQEQEIDGKSLLLMKRSDVLTGLAIKLGPALKIYEFHVKALQSHHFHSDASY